MRMKFNCGHRGLGKVCHRCELSKKVSDLVGTPNEKRPGAYRGKTDEELKAESARLSGPQKDHNKKTIVHVEPVTDAH